MPWQKIWFDARNQQLREDRGHPNILLPGDVVLVPEREIGWESGATEKRHRFRRKGSLVEIRIRLHRFGEPRADEPYHVEIGNAVYPGSTQRTDQNGLAIVRIPADAMHAILVVGDDEEEYELLVGHMDPIDSVTGIHSRLENMGFDAGGVHSPYDTQSAAAMAEYLTHAGQDPAKRRVRDPQDERNQDDLEAGYGL